MKKTNNLIKDQIEEMLESRQRKRHKDSLRRTIPLCEDLGIQAFIYECGSPYAKMPRLDITVYRDGKDDAICKTQVNSKNTLDKATEQINDALKDCMKYTIVSAVIDYYKPESKKEISAAMKFLYDMGWSQISMPLFIQNDEHKVVFTINDFSEKPSMENSYIPGEPQFVINADSPTLESFAGDSFEDIAAKLCGLCEQEKERTFDIPVFSVETNHEYQMDEEEIEMV